MQDLIQIRISEIVKFLIEENDVMKKEYNQIKLN